MARYTGKNLVVEFVHAGGTASLDADYRAFSTSEEIDSADSTAGDDTYKSFIPTVVDATAELELLDTTGSTATWAVLEPGTEGTVVWYPEGTAATKPVHSAPAFVESREREFPYDDVVSTTVAFHLTDKPSMAAVSA